MATVPPTIASDRESSVVATYGSAESSLFATPKEADMRTNPTTNQGPDVLPRRSRSTGKLLALTFAAGLVVAGYVMRRRIGKLLTQASSYVRR